MGIRPEDSVWTAARIGLLRSLIAIKASAAEAGKALGCSRNACLGKAHRLGWRFDTAMPKKAAEKPREPRVRQRKPPPPPLKPIEIFDGLAFDAAIPREQLKTIIELENSDCRWPVGHGPPFLYCSAPVIEGYSWCQHHRNRAFTRMGDSYGSNRARTGHEVRCDRTSAQNPAPDSKDNPTIRKRN